MKKSTKKKIVKIVSYCLIAIAVVVFLIINANAGKSDKELYDRIMGSEYDTSNKYAEYISYAKYLEKHGDAPDLNNVELELKGSDYTGTTMENLKVLENGQVITTSTGKIKYAFEVEKEGYYYIDVTYYPTESSDKNIKRKVYINGRIPFEEAADLTFERMFADDSKDFLMASDANQADPTQVQVSDWTSKKLDVADRTVDGPLMFYFEKGKNFVEFESIDSDMGIASVKLIGTTGMISYEEYLAAHKDAEKVTLDDGMITIQGEDTLYKSSAMIVPQNDRTSAVTVPYHASNIILNTIGGTSWADGGTSITWKVTVPKAGLYRIATRFLQAENRDFYSSREIKINGEIPFEEATAIKFESGTKFQVGYMGDGKDAYYFYLNEGENTITMTVSLGDLAFAVSEAGVCVKNFNNLYRNLTSVMGSDPDEYRDYKITESIPDMVEILETEYYRLNTIMASLGESLENNSKTRELSKMILQLEDLIKKPDTINVELSTFNDNITAISEWMLSLDSQPLQLDYIMVCGESAELPKAEGNIFQNLMHGVNAFIGSFTNDYRVQVGEEKEDAKTLEVWIATSTRDQYDIAQKLVINQFAAADYNVVIKMVGADTVMPATLTGNGPDVAIQLNYTMPTNFAYRNAAYDLTQFEDFDEVASRFTDGAMEYFEYEGGVYGLPDQMSFPVMFYRADILESMNLKVPNTWDELEAILPYLQAENMSTFFVTTAYTTLGGASSTTTKPVNPVFISLLYQNGQELYTEDGKASRLDELTSLLTFKKWTEFYTKQAFDLSISIVTRFRTGEAPIIIDDYTYINSISAAAPEIDGLWSIAPIPGTVLEDGTIDRSVACNVGACMMLKQAVEENDTANEAWDFIKWWTSTETQLAYAKEQKTILGNAANFPVGNAEAIVTLGSDLGFEETLAETLKWSRGIPQVPGGYISGRYVENSFLTVVNNNTDPVDTLYNNIRHINKEITTKRTEFGLD